MKLDYVYVCWTRSLINNVVFCYALETFEENREKKMKKKERKKGGRIRTALTLS